ncbi:8302_t:CDS:2, partial [Entrophospora sp. SA101]
SQRFTPEDMHKELIEESVHNTQLSHDEIPKVETIRMSFALQYQEKQIYNKHVLFAIARDSPMIHVYQARYWILLKN